MRRGQGQHEARRAASRADRVAGAALLVLAVSVQASCLHFTPFACEQTGDCDLVEGGACLDGGCAYPDDDCPSKLRFDGAAPFGHAGTCYDPDAGTTAATSDAATTTSSTAGASSGSSAADTIADSSSSDTTAGPCGGAFDPCCALDTCDDGLACFAGVCSCVHGIDAGDRHSCAALVSGDVLCWGANDSGQLGQSINPFETSPIAAVAVDPGDPVREIAATNHTCVRSDNGNLRCWGANASGQADPMNPMPTIEVMALPWFPSVQFLGAGAAHTCGHDGATLSCWGANGSSQLTGDPALAPGPVATGIGPITALVTGRTHGCVLQGEALSCWGANDLGQLATDPLVAPILTAPTVMPVTGVVAAAAGAQHTCAIDNLGAIHCWGRNNVGQLGDGTGVDSISPVSVMWPLEAGAPSSIVAGANHVCVIDDAGALWCWGSNGNGKIMLPPDMTGFDDYSLVPRAIEVGSPIVSMAPGETHGCVLTTEHRVLCWGRNDQGAVGDGTTNDAIDPREVDLCGG